jgi:hypothetical protein
MDEVKKKKTSRAEHLKPSEKRSLVITTKAAAKVPSRDPVCGEVEIARNSVSETLLAQLKETVQPDGDASLNRRLNAAIGCKTDAVALVVLGQVIRLQHVNIETDDAAARHLNNAEAILAELQPRTAMESLLGAQMVGAQHVAMVCLARAMQPNQSTDGVDRNILRATRLMRVFNEQVDAMAKLKGTAGQQKVTVEHVTVQSGGNAVVGVLTAPAQLPPGEGGPL